MQAFWMATMKVGIFYNSISNPAKFSNKTMLMDNFSTGVKLHGDQVIEYRGNALPDQQLDAGFVLGYTLEDNFRKKIINSLTAQKTPRVFVDSNILHYSRKEHEWHRYSLNSVYPGTGEYFFQPLDRAKWTAFSEWHGTAMQPWRTGANGQHVLILCQRPKGWNMFGNDQDSWLDRTIDQIRSIEPGRPIVVRMHPGDGTRFKQIEKTQKKHSNRGVTVSTNDNIRDDLINCWCTVGYNSTPNVVAAIEGIPGYVEDPVHSWAADVAFTDINQISNPPMPDRSEWAHKIANIHWSNEEVRTGQLWLAIKNYISASR
jgi:hypothetical protein